VPLGLSKYVVDALMWFDGLWTRMRVTTDPGEIFGPR